MAAEWHPANGFEPLVSCLFTGASYTSVALYPMKERTVINIELRIIKQCRMYSEEFKNWIACKNKSRQLLR